MLQPGCSYIRKQLEAASENRTHGLEARSILFSDVNQSCTSAANTLSLSITRANLCPVSPAVPGLDPGTNNKYKLQKKLHLPIMHVNSFINGAWQAHNYNKLLLKLVSNLFVQYHVL